MNFLSFKIKLLNFTIISYNYGLYVLLYLNIGRIAYYLSTKKSTLERINSMYRLRFFILFIFASAITVAFISGPIDVNISTYLLIFLVYFFFTALYSNLKTIVRTGNVNVDYSISYNLSLVLYTGPLGLFIFEVFSRFYVYFIRKKNGTADEDEFLHTFYNIGGPTLLNVFGYYCFFTVYPYLEHLTFGFWFLLIPIVIMIDILSSILLLIIFHFAGNISTGQDAWAFIKGKSMLDTLKGAISNGLLFLFLTQQHWEALIGLFILNYLVSRSAVLQSRTLQHKIERDRFEQMAYTDFLTKLHNRTYMNKIMNELNESEQYVGIVVTDIDTFKRINDTYNHNVGDKVIQHFANHIKSKLNHHDYVFRSGGEEFTIILTNRTYEECQKLVMLLKEEVERTSAPAEYRGNTIDVDYTATFGLNYCRCEENNDIRKAYIQADELLIKAKNNGKNRVHLFNSTSSTDQEEILTIENENPT